jgi:iron complex transport system substrate-binding protein
LVQARSDAYSYEHDPRFANIAAIKDHRVYIVPAGAQHWGNATTETPLAELWTARLLHPDATANIDIQAQAAGFYQRFYGVKLSAAQLSDIINSTLEPNTAGS